MKANQHPELEEIKETTRKKLRQVLFRMLREAGILDTQLEIKPVFLSDELKHISLKKESLSFLPLLAA